MNMRPIIAVLIALAAIGCSRTDTTGTASPPEQPGPANRPADKPMVVDTPADKPAGADVAADNTGKNERDRQPEALTPMDQGESASDRSITQQARQGVVKADEVSVSGKNVKIITNEGVVTLRGPVESAREKNEIASIVKQVDGVKRVDNQLEVAAK
jgi:osmotically-inducible protein OsmY